MDFAAKKQWLETNADNKYKAADHALLRRIAPRSREARRNATSDEAVLWHIINKELATPEEILANRAEFDKDKPEEEEQLPRDSNRVETKAEKIVTEVKKKMTQVFSKKNSNKKKKNTRK